MHNSIFGFIHSNYTFFEILFKEYTKSKYLISLVPFENDFLFKEWGINSILMNNFITYNYKRIIPSNLSSKIILMIGRANDKNKRFDLGIMSMEYIIQVIQNCVLRIISQLNDITLYLSLHRLINKEYKKIFQILTTKIKYIKFIYQNGISECLSNTSLIVTDF